MNNRHRPDNSFEEKKLRSDVKLRLRELALKKAELDLKRTEAARSRWLNPLVLAVIGAALATASSAGIAWLNGWQQRQVEVERNDAQLKLEGLKFESQKTLEEGKTEAARILEVIKTGDPDKAAENLQFLLDGHLIESKARRQQLAEFLKKRKAGEGPALSPSTGSWSFGSDVPLSAEGNWRLVAHDGQNDHGLPTNFFMADVTLEGREILKGEMTVNPNQKANVQGYYRSGTLILNFFFSDS
jgi:hypothetical protein